MVPECGEQTEAADSFAHERLYGEVKPHLDFCYYQDLLKTQETRRQSTHGGPVWVSVFVTDC